MITTSNNRKARRESDCPICHGRIRIGQRICKIGRRGTWMHQTCFMIRFRPAAATPDERTTSC